MEDSERNKALHEAGTAYVAGASAEENEVASGFDGLQTIDDKGGKTVAVATPVRELLDKTLAVLPITDEDIIVRGITAKVTDRIVELKKAALRLRQKYGSPENLERTMEREGVSPDDHTLYTDLLEWEAIDYELSGLMDVLESI